jgi:hypothetical protein
MIVNIYIAGQRLDLFKDESIEVVSSVADISDITKNTTDYSKSFTVPASDNNNKLFKHYYNADIDNTFDARIKQEGRIELGGSLFKEGKFRLDKVSVKKGKPSSYTINFFGNLVSLKDLFKDDELSSLDFTAFNHPYNSANVSSGLVNYSPASNFIYNLFTKKQLKYDDSNDTDDKLTNINWNGGAAVGIRFNELQPSLRVKRIIEAIETKYGITFSNDFFGLTEFTELFMWLNASSEVKLTSKRQINFDGGDATFMNLSTDIGSYQVTYNGIDLIDYDLTITVTPAVGYTTVPYKILTYNNGSLISTNSFTGTGANTTILTTAIPGVYDNDIYYEVESSETFVFSANLGQTQRENSIPILSVTTTASSGVNQISLELIISSLMPKMKVIDFMKGLFQMFKLVVIPTNETNIYVDTLQRFYTLGTTHDVTSYIDFESYDVERGNILNTIKYKYQDPTTINNQTYKKNNLIGYGDLEAILKDEDGVLLDGGSLDYTLPFEMIMYDRLINQVTSDKTQIQYGAIVNESLSISNPKPHLFYNINVNISSSPIAFRNDAGTKTQLNTTLNTPSHTNTFVGQTHSTTFGNDFSTWDGSLIENTLFSNYHEQYISDIFNIKKREFKFKAILPMHLILNIKLNDRLRIKNNVYIIDNMNINLVTRETTFNLINLL